MNNALQIFNNNDFGQVRIIIKDEEPWFIAVDVCNCLDLKNSRKALTSLDDDEKDVTISDTLGGKQQMSIVSESGLYNLIGRSRKKEAHAFRRWINHEVLPSIRKTGSYSMQELTDEQKLAESILIAQKVLAERDKQIKQLSAKIEEDKPKVEFADMVDKAVNTIMPRDMAKLLTQNGMKTRQKDVFDYLRAHKLIVGGNSSDKNRPTKYAIDNGWLVAHSSAWTDKDGQVHQSFSPRITIKGQKYLFKKFKGMHDVISNQENKLLN